MNHTQQQSGVENLLRFVNRYVYPCKMTIPVDEYGLLMASNSRLRYSGLNTIEECAQLPGAILLAEGGMGKTVFMDQLKTHFPDGSCKLISLEEYTGDSNGLRSAVEPILRGEQSSLILDGLDQAPDLAGPLLRILRDVPKDARLWLASREASTIRKIQNEHSRLRSFNLAPISLQDVGDIAEGAGLNRNDFIQAVKDQGLLSICAKPLGCDLAVSVYQENHLEGASQKDLWHRGIKRLCDEMPSKILASVYTTDQITSCAAWVSLCITLSDKAFIWLGEDTHCPEQCLSISDLVTAEYPIDLIRTSIGRGVFTPIGDGRIRFAHDSYKDYLAAYGLTKFVPPQHWQPLMLTSDRSGVVPRREGIAVWLAAHNKAFLDDLCAIQPEILLASADAVQIVGTEDLCTALLDRADSISYLQRRDTVIEGNLLRLQSDGAADVVKNRLLDETASIDTLELAIDIAKACHFVECADVLEDIAVDVRRPPRLRVESVAALKTFKNIDSKARIKALLPIDPRDDPDDELRGAVLSCCWPGHIPLDELIQHLSIPQKANFWGQYKMFLEYDLPSSLASVITVSNAPVLLKWALNHVMGNDPFDCLGDVARTIYGCCWQWATTLDITDLLADGYLNALSAHGVPFVQQTYHGNNKPPCFLSKEDFILIRFQVETNLCYNGAWPDH